MRHFSLLLLPLIAILFLSCLAQAQKTPVKKDSIRISCLLMDAKVLPEEKQAIDMGKEIKLAISSATDTAVKAVIDGVVTNIQQDEQGAFEVVFYHNDYWFWVSGIAKATVRKGQKLKRGDTIGIAPAGARIELLMYDFETLVDAKRYMDCK
jgi:Peptidase family M23